MNFKSLIAVGFGIATVAMSLPAHADSAIVVQNDQGAVVTGKGNVTTQRNSTGILSSERRNSDNSGIAVGSTQRADVLGEYNRTSQTNTTAIGSFRFRNK